MNKNKNQLASFVAYCKKHPNERFWQALRNWCGAAYVVEKQNNEDSERDTFYDRCTITKEGRIED